MQNYGLSINYNTYMGLESEIYLRESFIVFKLRHIKIKWLIQDDFVQRDNTYLVVEPLANLDSRIKYQCNEKRSGVKLPVIMR